MKAAFGHLTAVALMAGLAAAAFPALCDDAPSSADAADAARVKRRAALVAELFEEGAAVEARAEAARLRAEFPDAAEAALAPLCPRIALSSDAEAPKTTSRGGGIGGWLARRVVGFYRMFVGPAIGNRCVLQPSCSRYCLQASRKHGLLGLPMTADRFIREPNASAPDRPWVKTPSGEWRHPDPVEDHDFWFR